MARTGRSRAAEGGRDRTPARRSAARGQSKGGSTRTRNGDRGEGIPSSYLLLAVGLLVFVVSMPRLREHVVRGNTTEAPRSLLLLSDLAGEREPIRSEHAVALLHEAGYVTDARAFATTLPASPERDRYLEQKPAR